MLYDKKTRPDVPEDASFDAEHSTQGDPETLSTMVFGESLLHEVNPQLWINATSFQVPESASVASTWSSVLLKDTSVKVGEILRDDNKAAYWVGIVSDVKPVAFTDALFFGDHWAMPPSADSDSVSSAARMALRRVCENREKGPYQALLKTNTRQESALLKLVQADLESSMRQGRRIIRPMMKSILATDAKVFTALPSSEDEKRLIEAASGFISGKAELKDPWQWPNRLHLIVGEGKDEACYPFLANIGFETYRRMYYGPGGVAEQIFKLQAELGLYAPELVPWGSTGSFAGFCYSLTMISAVAYEWKDGRGLLRAKLEGYRPHFRYLLENLPKYTYVERKSGKQFSFKDLVERSLNTIAKEEWMNYQTTAACKVNRN